MTTQELLDQALSLPVEQRAWLADMMARSLNPCEPANAAKWLQTAQRRREELTSGVVGAVPGRDVLARLQQHLTQ